MIQPQLKQIQVASSIVLVKGEILKHHMILRLNAAETKSSNPFHSNFPFFTYRMLFSYSDGCTSQNKNYLLVKFLANLQHQGIYKLISHKFLVKGHTFLENNRDFTQIEEGDSQCIGAR